MEKKRAQAQAAQVVTIAGVRAYVDDKGVARLNVEDIARGLGFVEVKKGRVTTSGRKGRVGTSVDTVATNGDKPYMAIRWGRINGYLKEFADSPLVGKDFPKKVSAGDFVSETVFYLLAMKANNDAAKEFQWKVANEIIPSIRKYGYYSLSDDEPIKHASPTMCAGQLKPACVYAFLMSDNTVKIGNTADINDRIRRVERLSNLDVLKKYCTPKMPRKQAQVLERKMHKKFAAMRVCGEYFNVPFEEVCAELDKLAAEFAVVEESLPVQVNLFDSPEEIPDIDEPKIKLLVDLCAVPIDSPFKEQLIREAANLILGKKLF